MKWNEIFNWNIKFVSDPETKALCVVFEALDCKFASKKPVFDLETLLRKFFHRQWCSYVHSRKSIIEILVSFCFVSFSPAPLLEAGFELPLRMCVCVPVCVCTCGCLTFISFLHSSMDSTYSISASMPSLGNEILELLPKPRRSKAYTGLDLARASRFRAHSPTPDPIPCINTRGVLSDFLFICIVRMCLVPLPMVTKNASRLFHKSAKGRNIRGFSHQFVKFPLRKTASYHWAQSTLDASMQFIWCCLCPVIWIRFILRLRVALHRLASSVDWAMLRVLLPFNNSKYQNCTSSSQLDKPVVWDRDSVLLTGEDFAFGHRERSHWGWFPGTSAQQTAKKRFTEFKYSCRFPQNDAHDPSTNYQGDEMMEFEHCSHFCVRRKGTMEIDVFLQWGWGAKCCWFNRSVKWEFAFQLESHW